MRVLYIIDELARGGAETLALDFIKNAGAYDLDIEFVSLTGGELLEDFREASQDSFVLIKRKSAIDIFAILRLRKLIKDRKIEIIHTHEAVGGLYAYLAALGLGIPLVQTHHGFNTAYKKDNRVTKFLINRFDANIVVSRGFLERLRAESEFDLSKNFHVVYNGIDRKKISIQQSTIRHELKIPDGSVLLVMVGNFSEGKDQITICKALKTVFLQNSNIYMAFVGGISNASPQLYDECQCYCRENALLENIFFLGRRSDIPNILSGSDIFIFSSLVDTFGIALIEAMFLKKPCISSDIDPVKEITDNGKICVLYKKNDAADLASKILSLSKDTHEMSRLGKLSYDWVKKRYDISQHIGSLRKIYCMLLEQRKTETLH